MKYTETYSIVIGKPSTRSLNSGVLESQSQGIIDDSINKTRKVAGWSLIDGAPLFRQKPGSGKQQYDYEMYFTLKYDSDRSVPDKSMFAAILRSINDKAASNIRGRWTLLTVDGADYVPASGTDQGGKADDMIGYAELEIPEDIGTHFGHLYGLEPHIARVMGPINTAIKSDWRKRISTVLIGPPGCGKSDICESLRNALGSDAVMKFDATATTQAGAIKQLAEADILPRIIIFEEIEKAPEAAMTFLLGVTDLRGEIRKVTAKGTVNRDTRVIAIATVNNEELFDRLQAGALSSRFMNKVYFDHPDRATLELILQREIVDVDGNMEWIAPTLDYCEEHGIQDPRQIIAHCLLGAEGWLDGTYPKTLAATAKRDPNVSSEREFSGE